MNTRTVDALIAEHVFELQNENNQPDYIWIKHRYSTAIADAWPVVEKMRAKNFHFKITNSGEKYFVSFKEDPDNQIRGAFSFNESAPMAICLASLKALGVEVKK